MVAANLFRRVDFEIVRLKRHKNFLLPYYYVTFLFYLYNNNTTTVVVVTGPIEHHIITTIILPNDCKHAVHRLQQCNGYV